MSKHFSLTTEEDREGNPVRPAETNVDRGRERYARGDITREEFEQIKIDLQDQ